ncbi:MAG: PaaI family thioesterase [Pseudomonadota bacterium]
MSTPEDLSPAIRDALTFAETHLRTQHALFREIPFRTKKVERGEATIEVTLPKAFADGEAIHGGLYTILLDTLLGIAAWSRMEEFLPIVTINLKTDFYGEAPPEATIRCTAHCEGIVDDVAICHGRATTLDGKLLAHAAGTFLVSRGRVGEKESRL